MNEMHCCTCNNIKSDVEVYWGQDCDNCRDSENKSHGCYIPSVDFTKINKLHSLFANIIKPHHFLRLGARVKIIYWDGGLTGAYVGEGISKSGRRVGSCCGMWIPLRYLGNYRIKWSYKKFLEWEREDIK